jgi:polyisoprenoid-binding protein YceI
MKTFRRMAMPLLRTAALLTAACIVAPLASAQAPTPASKGPATNSKAASAKTALTAKAKPAAPIRFAILSIGNEARYRVREQLMGADLPNDAIGKTTDITGTILVYPDGRIVRDSSRIVVNVSSLKSDKDRRDGFIQRRTLETDKFPTVVLAPTSVRGFSGTIPTSGSLTFELLGDLTVHGVTRPTVWQVTAHVAGEDVTGTARTAFTFKDIGLDQPRVPVVLSVADTITLEYDFRFARPAGTP